MTGILKVDQIQNNTGTAAITVDSGGGIRPLNTPIFWVWRSTDYTLTNGHTNMIYNKVDIALDTFPYTGVTTTFEALWKGIPVITMAGHNFKSRCGESILKNAKLESLICSDSNDYINKTLKLVKDIDNLKILRTDLFTNVLKTPLFDKKKYTMEFQKILLTKYSR